MSDLLIDFDTEISNPDSLPNLSYYGPAAVEPPQSATGRRGSVAGGLERGGAVLTNRRDRFDDMASLAGTVGFLRDRVPFEMEESLRVHLTRHSVFDNDQSGDILIPPPSSFSDVSIDHCPESESWSEIRDTWRTGPAGQLTGNSFTHNDQSQNTVVRRTPTTIPNTDQLLANVLTQLTTKLSNMNSPKLICRVSFEGLDTEDPQLFLNELVRHFRAAEWTDTVELTNFAIDKLKGGALKWAAPLRAFRISFQEFSRRFLRHYDSDQIRRDLTAKFYGEHQRDGESVNTFLSRKRAIYFRITNPLSFKDEFLTGTTLSLMRPEIRARLRFAGIKSMEGLIQAAEEVERDLMDEFNSQKSANRNQSFRRPQNVELTSFNDNTRQHYLNNNKKNKHDQPMYRQPKQSEPSSNGQRTAPIEKPQGFSGSKNGCFICGGPHFARVCPKAIRAAPAEGQTVNAVYQDEFVNQENSNRAGVRPSASAPPNPMNQN